MIRRTKECRISNGEVPRSTLPESRTNGRLRHRTARDSVRQLPDCIPGYSNGAIPAGFVGPGSDRDGRCPWSPSLASRKIPVYREEGDNRG